MTAAEELRTAAEKLRDAARRADRESPAPWRLDEDVVRCDDGGIVADASGEPDHDGDLPYIAAMHPGVGAALADWLDAEAAIWDAVQTMTEEYGPKGIKVSFGISTQGQALAVARQILASQP